MSPHGHDPEDRPTPEQLAAFAGGELDVAEAEAVAAWLAGHPEVVTELEEQVDLARLFELTSPPEPSPQTWALVFRRVEAALAPTPARATGRRRLAFWAAFLGGAAAAALLVAALLQRFAPPTVREAPRLVQKVDGQQERQAEPREEPFPVLADDEVTIQSVDDDDRGAIVVGRPPVAESLTLVSEGEVTVDRIEQDEDGMKAQYTQHPGVAPMVYAQLRPYAPGK